jgi:hypothetical protein
MFCRAVPETPTGIRRLAGAALAARDYCRQLGARLMVTRTELREAARDAENGVSSGRKREHLKAREAASRASNLVGGR